MSSFPRLRGTRSIALSCFVAGAALLIGGCASSVAGDAGTQSRQQAPNPPSNISADSSSQPSTDQQSTDQQSTDEPSTDQPSTDQQTGTDEPSTDQQTADPATTDSPVSTAATPTVESTSQAAPVTSTPSVVLTTVVHTATVTGTAAAGPTLNLDHFASPSGNISCMIMTDTEPQVRCDLAESAISDQHDCNGTGDWGHSITLIAGKKAAMRCISDTVMQPGIPPLAYGQKTQVGPITCTSEEDGMHCADTSGHGFRLAKASYDVS